jgi:DNA-binding IclR family transcriptional regulator
MDETVPVLSLKKALDALDLIIEAGLRGADASLGGLARRMKLRPNSLHNLLKTMMACGYVEKTGHGLYVQGLKCRQLGRMNALTAPAVQEKLQGRLKQLAAEEGEACLLTVLVNGERVVVSRVDSTQVIQVSHATQEDRQFFSLATGRILAVIATETELKQIVERHGMPGDLWEGISTEPGLKKALAGLLQQGGGVVQTRDNELIGLACPVLGTDGRGWGALGLYAPAFRCPPKRCDRLAKALRRAAADLSTVLPDQGC